ncbi:conserved hypothetical protein [Theileria orientalis strain Shintoku]|uniref:Uncharacterized protein n=1 Tax=Theileria orientalis strain Shintoku TaxID=869250 RepID=J4CD76_THEOR|nr:conserved hypothetical protein [Theileria orientalis strain Shintoku]BAM40657.1 conserved hypothetical protein [Theileria orientalis strain Shintoku]|eukprot:XP_009690958.1 conserved hypothetical protein [Theileria orientalis strain Shintoku]
MESSDVRLISEETINKLLTVYTNNKWHSLPDTLSSSLPPAKRSTLLTGLSGLSVEKIGKIGRELMYSISKKYVLLVCKTDFEQKWLHMTADDPFGQKSPKSSKTATFADKVDSVAVLIHNNCVFNWTMFNRLLNLAKSDKLRVKAKCTDLMYSSFMEVLPLRKLKYIDDQDVRVLEYLSSSDRKEGAGKDTKGWDTLEFDALTLLLAITFEDYLKGIYSSFIHELADMMNRGVDFLQKSSSNLVLQMLIQKPEQEDLLLDLIVNRLTHKNNKMSSYVFKMLDTLLLNHPNMKTVVVKKIVTQLDSSVGSIESLINGFVEDNAKDKSTGSSELVPILKNIYRFILYISKLQYTKADAELVSTMMNNNVNLLLLFTGRAPKMANGAGASVKGSSNTNATVTSNRAVFVAGLYRLDECNRVIKVLLLFTNKLLNHYKKVNLYEEKRNLLISNGIDKNLYHLSRETRSSSITILLLLLLHNIDPVNNSYINVLYENVFNTKLYESSNILKFLNLVEQILDTNKDFTRNLIRKLLQMGLCNYNNSINCAIIDLIQKYINEGNLWELYLYNSTYNPHVVKSISNVNARSNITGLYDELNVFSNCSRVDYTFAKYWENNKQPELHQRPFELYYRARSSILSSEARPNDASGTLASGTAAGKAREQAAKRRLDGEARGAKDVKETRKGTVAMSSGIRSRTDRGAGLAKAPKTGTRNGADAGSLVGKATAAGAAASRGRKKRRVAGKSQAAPGADLGEDDSDIEIDEPEDDDLDESSVEPTDDDDSSYRDSSDSSDFEGADSSDDD